MKIIHISPTYHPAIGGGELHMKELSEGLVFRGHDVTVLTANVRSSWELFHRVNAGLPDREVVNGVNVVRFEPTGGIAGAWLRRWLVLPGGWRLLSHVVGKAGMEMLGAEPQMLQIIPYLLQNRADVVMAMNWHWSPAYYAYLAKRLKHFVLVGIPQFHTNERWCERPVYNEMLPVTTAVVANTAYEESFMRAHGASRVVVGGVGVRADNFACRNGDDIRARYGIGSAPVVGFVGRQEVNKGVVQLIDAMKIVWNWNAEVRLILAGHRSNEHQGSAVKVAIEQLSASERQRLICISQFAESEKASLYDSFDIFALPSVGESFGLAYLEAWLCKKPAIGARIGSTECVINDGVDGLLVDPMDPQDLAGKIIILLSDRAKREQMGINGYSKTMAFHTWDRVVDRVEMLYRELTSSENLVDEGSGIIGRPQDKSAV